MDKTNNRLLRTGILANLLVKKGHDVIWWTSTFDHIGKRQRFNTDTIIKINENLKIILLHSVGYKRNVSLARIFNHRGIARKFLKLADRESRPDMILCSLPPLELSSSATLYGKQKNLPVILDIRDLWPDIFLELVPSWGRKLTKTILLPLYRTVSRACADATAIVGITPAFVNWGLNFSSRLSSDLDKDFPMGYSETPPPQPEIRAATRRWEECEVSNADFNICFFGYMGRQFELDVVIEAAKKLRSQGHPFRFILCGGGDRLDFYKKKAKGCNNVVFPGWMGRADIWTLMRLSSVGLAPYLNSKNFTMNLPNKPLEYLSAGLPIVSNLQGVLKDLLFTYNCGVTYTYGNSDELAKVLIDLHDKPNYLKIMAKNASELYKEKFVAEKVYGNMINHLESVCLHYRDKKEQECP
jgi:glycosyltransferase involved in cell wall biosynthesis